MVAIAEALLAHVLYVVGANNEFYFGDKALVDDIIGGTWVLVHHTKRELKYDRYSSVCVNAIFCLTSLHPFSNRPMVSFHFSAECGDSSCRDD